MITTARKLLDLIGPQERLRLALLFGAIVVMAFLQMVSIAAILPFLSVAADPSLIDENRWLGWGYRAFGFTSTNHFLIVLGALALAALVISNAWMAATQWSLYRFGSRVWYDDQRQVHEQIERGEEVIDYAFMGTDPNAADNRWLREAFAAQVPILYFLGVAPGRYTPIWPTYIDNWSASELKVQLAFGAAASSIEQWQLPDAPERRYGLRLARRRLHQATFREAVLSAYDGRCAISRYSPYTSSGLSPEPAAWRHELAIPSSMSAKRPHGPSSCRQ